MSGGPYHLRYFDVYARGEPIRWIFAQAGVEYTDERVDSDYDNFVKNMKDSAGPFNAFPILFIGKDKKILAQHITICRYLGNQFGLTVDDEFDKYRLDMYADGANELWEKFEPWVNIQFFGGSEEDAEKAWNAFNDFFNLFVKRYAGFLTESGTGYLVGNKLTWVDLYVAEWIQRATSEMNRRTVVDNPVIKEYVHRITSLPAIADHLAKRPKSPLKL